MNTGKFVVLIPLVIFINLLFSDIGISQTKRADETFFLSGMIKDVSWDHKSIVVNDKKFFISHDTKIVDQKGNILKLEDIKNNSEVAIDVIPHPDGFIIKKIVLITERGV